MERSDKPPLQNRRQTEGRGCLHTLPRCEGGRPKVKGGFRGWVTQGHHIILKAKEVIALPTTSPSLKALTICYFFI